MSEDVVTRSEFNSLKEIITEIRDLVATGRVGDGKIFIRNIEDAVRIRTGERGNKAL